MEEVVGVRREGTGRRRTRNVCVLRQRLVAVQTFAATVDSAGADGVAKEVQSYNERGGGGGRGFKLQVGVEGQIRESRKERTYLKQDTDFARRRLPQDDWGPGSPQTVIWGGQELLNLMSGGSKIAITPLATPRKVPPQQERQRRQQEAEEEKDHWFVGVAEPLKQQQQQFQQQQQQSRQEHTVSKPVNKALADGTIGKAQNNQEQKIQVESAQRGNMGSDVREQRSEVSALEDNGVAHVVKVHDVHTEKEAADEEQTHCQDNAQMHKMLEVVANQEATEQECSEHASFGQERTNLGDVKDSEKDVPDLGDTFELIVDEVVVAAVAGAQLFFAQGVVVDKGAHPPTIATDPTDIREEEAAGAQAARAEPSTTSGCELEQEVQCLILIYNR